MGCDGEGVAGFGAGDDGADGVAVLTGAGDAGADGSATGGGAGAVTTGSCGTGGAGFATDSGATAGTGSATGCGSGSGGLGADCAAGSSDWAAGGSFTALRESETGVSSLGAQPAASSNSRMTAGRPARMYEMACNYGTPAVRTQMAHIRRTRLIAVVTSGQEGSASRATWISYRPGFLSPGNTVISRPSTTGFRSPG